MSEDNAEEILSNYKRMMADCQQIASKINEVSERRVVPPVPSHQPFFPQLTLERDEHKLVVETLSKLESERRAFRMVGGILVERTVGDVLPTVAQNYEGVSSVPLLLCFMLTKRVAY